MLVIERSSKHAHVVREKQTLADLVRIVQLTTGDLRLRIGQSGVKSTHIRMESSEQGWTRRAVGDRR